MERQTLRELTASRVRSEITRQELTLEGVSDASGIPLSVLSEKVTGTTAFDVDELDAIALALGVPVVSFLTYDDDQ